jgi:hypothetical protein
MARIFWYNEGMLSVEFLKRGVTVNSERCVQTLKKLKQRIRRFRPGREINLWANNKSRKNKTKNI